MPADDLYWSPVDIDSEESNNFYKSYIDPWDLENYAYIREHLNSLEISSDSSGGVTATEPVDTSFSYVPSVTRSRSNVDKYGSLMESERTAASNYAAIDELTVRDDYHRFSGDLYKLGDNFYKRRPSRVDDFKFGSRNYVDADENLYGDQETAKYFYSRRRDESKVPSARIKRRSRSCSYSQGDYDYEPISSVQIYSRLDDIRPPIEAISPIYDDVRSAKPRNFSLSNYGHLKIDYSYSWNNLNKYIYN